MFKYVKKILSYFSPYKCRMLIISLCAVVNMVVSFFIPILSSKIVDDGLISKNFKIIVITSCALIGLYIVNSIFELILEKNRLFVYNNLHYDIERKAFNHLLSVKLSFFNNRNSTSISNMIVQDVSAVSTFVSADAFNVIIGLLSSISAAVSLFFMNWKLGIAVLLFIPINLIFSFIMTKMNTKTVEKYLEKSDEYNNWFGDSVNGVKEIRLFGVQKLKCSEIRKKQKELINLNIKRDIISKLNDEIEVVLFNGFSIGLYIVGGYFMLKNNLTVGEVIAFQTYSAMVANPIIYGIHMMMQVVLLTPFIKRHFDFMEYEDETSGNVVIKNSGDIEFRNICFFYNSENQLINDLNFTIPIGGKVALIGNNGVGKTTTLNLILRFLSPVSGQILMDGRNINEYEITSYRKMFAVVNQDVFLFNDSILNNICLYNDFDKHRLHEIIKLVNLDGLVNERGLSYNVGINGSKLSGGQKQKIALARALIYDSPVIILDEATSNLDLETISVIRKLLETEFKNRTVICVTHTMEISEIFKMKINL